MSGRVPRLPVILAHGFLGTSDYLKLLKAVVPSNITNSWKMDYFRGISDHLKEKNVRVCVPQVPRIGSIKIRAESLREQILSFRKSNLIADKVNIIGHSMGGLDARYLVSHMDGENYVASLTTIVTPHRGTPIADFFVNHAVAPLSEKLKSIPLPTYFVDYFSGVLDLTTDYMKEFNRTTPDNPKVKYYSVTASIPPEKIPLLWRFTYDLVYSKEGKNDGLVSTFSSEWGEHIKSVECDHTQTINWNFNVSGANDFNAVLMFDELMDFLAKRNL